MGGWSEPASAEWEKWEEAVYSGRNPGVAARDLGLGGSSAFKRSDPERHRRAMDYWRANRDETDSDYVREKLRENAEHAMAATPVLGEDGDPIGVYTYQGNVANKSLELLGKAAGMFDETVKHEVSGPEGAPIQLEGRAVVGLADVVQLAIETGQQHLLGLDARDSRGALPAASDVLPDPADGEPSARSVSAA